MENLLEKTISSIVVENYRAAAVFEKNGIDFCCNGKVKLGEACLSKGIAPEIIEKELEDLKKQNLKLLHDFNTIPLDGLVRHIEDRHHTYVKDSLPQLQAFLEKLCTVHGDRHPELKKIKELFDEGAGNLSDHMKKEENILFPYVRRLVESGNLGIKLSSQFGTVRNPIEVMESEHEAEGKRFEQIRMLSNNYTPPEDACTTYRVTYAMLKEFEEDLHMHIHLENNILFPKTMDMEKEIMNS